MFIPTASQILSGFGQTIGYDQIVSNVTVTSTTEATGDTVIACAAHTFDGAPVIFEFFSPIVDLNGALTITICLFESATEIGRIAVYKNGSAVDDQSPITGKLRFSPSAGSHSYTVTAFMAAGTGTVGAGAGGTGNTVPAFVRFTKE